ncbi:MAG: right-handed parallel beta-helix repeat-containing protein [Actinomycetota bacterium]
MADKTVTGTTTVRRRWWRVLLTATLLTAGMTGLIPDAAEAQAADETFVVTSTGDGGDANGADGVCRTSGGQCTLRAAVEQANFSRGDNRINFNIGGSGTRVINVGAALVLNDPSGGTTIDGYSQPGSAPNSAAGGSNAVIRIALRGSTGSSPVIRIESAANTIKGLAIRNGQNRIELRGEGADGNTIQGNFIGFEPDGSVSTNSGIRYGVLMQLGPDRNLIGGPNPADRNVISGNGDGSAGGVRINHGETSQNVIENNIVGLSPDLSRSYAQGIGIDIQYWSWGNHIEDNVVSGHTNFGIDLSHSSVETTVIGNHIGTLADGNTTTNYTGNYWSGLALKDNATKNYITDNVIMGGRNTRSSASYYGIYGRHDFNGPNTIVGNRIGVGRNGATDADFDTTALLVNGYDDLILDNILAVDTNRSPVVVVEFDGGNGNYPRHPTENNRLHQNTYRQAGTSYPLIDINDQSFSGWPTSVQNGYDRNDSGDNDNGPHDELNWPEIRSYGPGAVTGTACGGCEVEIYLSGAARNDGSIDPGSTSTGTGAAWIGRVTADGQGRWGLADGRIRSGKYLYALAIDASGDTSEMTARITIQNGQVGSQVTSPQASENRVTAPPVPSRPPAYQPDVFTCSAGNGVLSWENEGASEYYVWSVNAQGVETYLGPQQGTSLNVASADSYRVEHWARGFARNATCRGDGDGNNPGTFTCSVSNGVLSWTNVGAPEYYVFATTNGTERYLGGHQTTSLNVANADSYRVEHWITGQVTNATCP